MMIRYKICLFLATGLVLFQLFDWFIMTGVSKSAKGQLGKVNKICNQIDLPQIAIFGSSVGEVGINAPLLQKKTNKSVYNFCIDGTPFSQYYGLINEISGTKNTELVVMAEAYFSLERKTALSEFQRYIANIQHDNIYNSLYKIQPDIVWKARYVPMYKYTVFSHLFYLSSIEGWSHFLKKNTPKDTLLGFTPVFRNWELDQDEAIKKIKPFKIVLDTTVIAEYKKTIKNLKNQHKNVVIVMTPIYSAVSNTLTDFEPMRKTFKAIAAETECKFLDFSQNKICNDKSFFYNSNHLNNKGADIFSSALADSLNILIKPQISK